MTLPGQNTDPSYDDIKRSIDEQLGRIQKNEELSGFSAECGRPVKKESFWGRLLKFVRRSRKKQ